jgi:hypothetical protein
MFERKSHRDSILYVLVIQIVDVLWTGKGILDDWIIYRRTNKNLCLILLLDWLPDFDIIAPWCIVQQFHRRFWSNRKEQDLERWNGRQSL